MKYKILRRALGFFIVFPCLQGSDIDPLSCGSDRGLPPLCTSSSNPPSIEHRDGSQGDSLGSRQYSHHGEAPPGFAREAIGCESGRVESN